MTTQADIKRALEDVTHASQTKSVVAMLLGYLHEAGVRSPEEIEQEERAMYVEDLHRRLAETETTRDVDELVQQAGEDGTDEAFVRAAAERRQVLGQREADDSQQAESNVRDYGIMSYAELQAEAKGRGLAATGSKADLVARLSEDDRSKAEPEQPVVTGDPADQNAETGPTE